MNKATLTKLIIAAVCLTVSLCAYMYWYHLLTVANAHVAELDSEIVAQNALTMSSASAESELENLAGARSDIEGYFVVTDNIVSFLEALQSLGKRLGTDITVASVTAGSTPRPHIDLALTATGSFAAVMRTVGAIEFSPYDISVSTLTLSTVTTDQKATWTAALTLVVGTASSTPHTAPQGTASTTP